MSSIHHALRRSHVAVVLLSAGCGVSDRSKAIGPGRSDSAGVEIVRNTDEPLARGELVQPASRVFGSEEEGPELFGRVGTARLHRNGSLWITDSQAREIRVFDPGSGAHLFTIGGRGDGPGEFRRSAFLGFDGEGSAYAYDFEHRRLSVFSESGEFQRSHLMPSSLGISPRPLHVTPAGTLLGQIPREIRRIPVDGSTVRDTVRIWTMPLDGTAPTLVWEAPSALWYFRDGVQVVVPYTGVLPGRRRSGDAGAPPDDRTWDVFDAEGILVGDIRLLANVVPVQVSGQSVLTIAVDEMGRRTVAIHDVRWTG